MLPEPTDNLFTQPVQPQSPIVIVRDGVLVADSRDVAAYFRKQHKDVLKAIRELHCSGDFRQRNFAPFKIRDLAGESTSHVEMTRDGFTFVALGFTGETAGQFKEAYIGEFSRMEAELRSRPAPAINVRDPSQLASIAIQLIEVNKELETRAVTAEARVVAAEPKVAFYDCFADAEGLYGLQNAGRVLAQGPNKFISALKMGYLFYQGGSLVPKVQYRESGLFEVKPYVGEDGKAHYQTYVTPKGITYFAKKLGVTPMHLREVPADPEERVAS